MAALLSCTTGGGTVRLPPPARPAQHPQAVPAGMQSVLPAPATLRGRLKGRQGAKSASYDSDQLFKAAQDYDPVLPNQHVAATANGATFTPSWDPATPGFAGLSFAIYRFQIPDYAGNSALSHQWFWPPTDPQSVYFAFANWAGNRWDFYPASADTDMGLPSFAPYLDPSGLMLVCALRIGGDQSELAWLRIGSLPPMRSLTASPRYGFAPLTVTFDASVSTDPDGSIVDYRWDPEGDGSFDLSTGTVPQLEWVYETPGDYPAALRLVDNDNVYSTATLRISALAEGALTYGSDPGDEDISSVIPLDDGSLMLLGHWDDLLSSNNQVFAARLTTNGTLDFSKLWGGEPSDIVFDAALGPDGYVYACGSTSSGSNGSQDALLQKWTQDGELVFSEAVGTADYAERYLALTVIDGAIFACGEFTDQFISRDYGLVSRLDTEGNVLWSSTIISPESCTLHDIKYYIPIAFGDPVLKICGGFEVSASDYDCLYLQLGTAGNILQCKRWGSELFNESGRSVDYAGNFTVQTYVAGVVSDESASWSFIGKPGGTTVTIQDVVRVTADSLEFPTLLLTRSVSSSAYSSVLATFDGTLALTAQTELGSAPDGSTIPRVLAGYAGGLLIAGMHWAELPAESSLELTVQPSAAPWVDISPPQGSPGLSAEKLPTTTYDTADMLFNRGADRWDAFLYLHR